MPKLFFNLITIFSILLFSALVKAQITLNPLPVSGEIVLSAANTYVYLSNSGSASITPSISLGSNANGISLSLNRCTTVLKVNQSCYVIVSFPSYSTNSQAISLSLNNGASSLASLKFNPTVVVAQTSNFAVSSLVINDFNSASFVVQNKTSLTKSYSPIISGTDASKYSITLNRCSLIAAGGTCLVYVKLAPQMAGSFSASITESQVTGSISLSSTITGATVGVIQPPNPSILVSPSSIDFGTLTQIGPSAGNVVTITNNGNVSLSPIVSVAGTGLSISLNRCLTLIAPTQSCSVSLIFTADSSMTNGTQSGLSLSAQANSSTSLLSVGVLANLSINPTLLTTSAGSSQPTMSPYIVYSTVFSNEMFIYDSRTKTSSFFMNRISAGYVDVEDTTYFATSSNEIYKITAANPVPQLETSNSFDTPIHPLYLSEKSPLVNGKKIIPIGPSNEWHVFSKTSIAPATFIPSAIRSLYMDSFVSKDNLYMAVRESNAGFTEFHDKILKTDGSSSSIVPDSSIPSFLGEQIHSIYKAGDDIVYITRNSNAGTFALMKIVPPTGSAQSVLVTSEYISSTKHVFYFNNQLFLAYGSTSDGDTGEIRYVNNGNLVNISATNYVGILNAKIISASGTSLKQTNNSLVESSFSDLSAFGSGPVQSCEIKSTNIYCAVYNGSTPIQGNNQYSLVRISSSGTATLLASDFQYGGSNVGILENFWVVGSSIVYLAENANGMLTARKVNLTTLANSVIEPQFETYSDVAVTNKAGSYIFHDTYGNYGPSSGGLIVAPDLTFTYTPKTLWFNRAYWLDQQ